MTDEQRLQMITEQLILVRDNLFRGMSKSMQKLQARSINEVLELPNHTQSPPAELTHECSRSHPHENMDAMCELRTEIARLTNENARLKAQRTWVGLTLDDVGEIELWVDFKEEGSGRIPTEKLVRYIEAKLKEKNT